ncbi:hypothetical protein HMPREF1869_00682 [Bacteroidales bacterium KA00251]|nr:hypothetical protein HMPREF1869_00682 [Bacteroidales bacterium KA00251]
MIRTVGFKIRNCSLVCPQKICLPFQLATQAEHLPNYLGDTKQ